MSAGRGRERPTVAVVGGGITGLVAAHHLIRSEAVLVSLHEAGTRLGGKVRTGWLGDGEVLAERGPEGFVAQGSEIPDLCAALGIGELVVPSATGAVLLWSRGRLRRLPTGLSMGLPVRPFGLIRSRVLTPRELARVSLDLVLPRARLDHDVSIGELVGPRFGRAAVERLVEPLVGGVYAGTAQSIGADSALPGLRRRLEDHRSLIRALRSGTPPATPGMATLRGGLRRLIDALGDDARRRGARVNLGSTVTGLRRLPGGGFQLLSDDRVLDTASAVIVAVPAAAAAGILSRVSAAASGLDGVGYSPVAVVSLLYPAHAFPRPPTHTGLLVPRADARLLRACTWTGVKWPHLARDGILVARCSVGSFGDPGPLDLGDAALADRLHAELRAAVGASRPPREWLVTRWPRAIPQYGPGHRERVRKVRASLPSGVVLAGAAYEGLGLSACVRQGRNATIEALAHLKARDPGEVTDADPARPGGGGRGG